MLSRQTPGGAAMRRYAILEAPSILGLKPGGVERLAEALLGYGLAESLRARRAGAVSTLAYDPEVHPTTRTRNAQAIAAWSPRLADAVERILDREELPIVLGGDCSIVLGSMLALRRRGRYGLLFIDGHADFYQPEANPTGEAASMDLAFVTGHGPRLLTDLERRAPLVREEDTVAFAFRDEEEQRAYGSQPLPPALRAFPLRRIREVGIAASARAAVEHVTRPELDGFFIHIDADCLNDDVMPAVDYRLPDGLSFTELSTTLAVALGSGKAVGLEVTIYNPRLDPDGAAGRGLTSALVEALSR